MTPMGQEEPFPRPRRNGRCGFRKRSLAVYDSGTQTLGQVLRPAPSPIVAFGGLSPGGTTLPRGVSLRRADIALAAMLFLSPRQHGEAHFDPLSRHAR